MVKLRIEKVVYPGRRLGFLEGKVAFTDLGLPGELVEAEVIRERPSYVEAVTRAIIEPSPRRCEPRCGHFAACSPFQEMEDGLQLELKVSQVKEIFARELGLDLDGLTITPSPIVWGYRNRVRLAVRRVASEFRLAYRVAGFQDEYVPVDRCHLVSDAMSDALEAGRTLIAGHNLQTVEEVEARESQSLGGVLLILHLGGAGEIDRLTKLSAPFRESASLTGVVATVPRGKRRREVGLAGTSGLEERVGGTSFRFGPSSFFQANTRQIEAVTAFMRASLAGFQTPVLADLYCGVGTFGLLLAGTAKEVVGVESDPANIAALRTNIALNRVTSFTIGEGRSEEWIGRVLDRGVDAVILDPPRKGVDGRILTALVERPVACTIYLSCNPATLARDLKTLLGVYRLTDIRVFDFFPHTPHIETCVVLSRE
ncbi:MAG: 23S rRNA (uracil(1939)-C(5))-methyltransferase RlmD [Candidatus Aminicenantes bacterium]|nr:23S rRNA (uracil(1939)-C(5))-methyltransferase RlmD [Candidatus Aminicenantes bacterium]